MKGFIAKAVLFGTAAGGAVGCFGYREIVDPCYPQRYEYAARHEVTAALAPQVQNGHILDQTVWNYHFEPGTDRLNAGGIDHLARLARTRPQPDPMVYMQTAQDVIYDAGAPDKMTEVRNDLDAKRIAAVQHFLSAQTASRALTFQVQIHDPSEVGIPAGAVDIVVRKMNAGYVGKLAGSGASPAGGAGAGAATGSK